MLTALPGRVGLIGNPVEHSLSPVFQEAAFKALGIDATYELWKTSDDEVDGRLQDMREGLIFAANVTVPHKETVFSKVDSCSDLARQAGAVNTLIVRDGGIYGDNTDVYGFLCPLRERDFAFGASNALILGAGGASRAVIVALLSAGIAQVTVANRTIERAEKLARDLQDPRIKTVPIDAIDPLLSDTQLLVNATALGWEDESPIGESLLAMLSKGAIAYDLTYRDTPFLAAASRANLESIDGLPMLVHQGAKSFEIWTGQNAPIAIMMEAARAERDRRTSR